MTSVAFTLLRDKGHHCFRYLGFAVG